MKPSSARSRTHAFAALIVICAVQLCSAVGWAETPGQLRHELAKTLVHRTVYIRHAYHGSYLHYDASGRLLNHVLPGYWSESAAVYLTKLEVGSGGLLHMQGDRVAVSFDHIHGRWQGIRRNEAVLVVEVQFDPAQMTLVNARAAVNNIFALTPEELAHELPDYWQPCISGVLRHDPARNRYFCFDKDVAPDMHSHAPIRTTAPMEDGTIERGQRLDSPMPRMTELAREMRFSGSSVLWVVVDEEGRPAEIYIASPAGYGLDDEAVIALANWRFAPAKLNGKPIRVQTTVEVSFKVPLTKTPRWRHLLIR